MRQDDIATVKIEYMPHADMVGASVIGTRDYQQDTYFMIETVYGSLAVICDGMGGMEHGELASQRAVEKLVGDFEKYKGKMSIPDFLEKEADKLDRVVANLKDEEGNPVGGGSTIVAVIVVQNKLYWLSVGDSRIYLYRDGKETCLTKDHNYGTQLLWEIDRGEKTPEDYERAGREVEALTSYLGIGGLSLVDVSKTPVNLQVGDRVLLCSDGLYKNIGEETIRDIVIRNRNPASTLHELFDAAEGTLKKHKDNTTAILVSYI